MIHTYTHTCMHACIYIYISYVYICMCIRLYVCMYIYIYIYICLYVCMYVCACMYSCTSAQLQVAGHASKYVGSCVSIYNLSMVVRTPCIKWIYQVNHVEVMHLYVNFIFIRSVSCQYAQLNFCVPDVINMLYESHRRKPGWRFTAGFEFLYEVKNVKKLKFWK